MATSRCFVFFFCISLFVLSTLAQTASYDAVSCDVTPFLNFLTWFECCEQYINLSNCCVNGFGGCDGADLFLQDGVCLPTYINGIFHVLDTFSSSLTSCLAGLAPYVKYSSGSGSQMTVAYQCPDPACTNCNFTYSNVSGGCGVCKDLTWHIWHFEKKQLVGGRLELLKYLPQWPQ